MHDAMNKTERQRGLSIDLERYPHGAGTVAYGRSKGIADSLGLLDSRQYAVLPQFAQLMHSPVVGKMMRLRGQSFHAKSSTPTAEQETCRLFNHQFVTYNESGRGEQPDSLNIIDPVALIRKCFPEGREDQWPTLLLTTNHALTSDHTHIAGIMRGLRKMVEDAHGRTLDYVAHPDDHENFGGKTLILSSIFTQPTPQENGADLLDRLQELGSNRARPGHTPMRGTISSLPAAWYDWAINVGANPSELLNPRSFTQHFLPSRRPEREHASPAARRLSKFLLAMMVTEPERIHFDGPCTEAKLMTGDAEGRRASVPDYLQIPEPPLVLREDASRAVSRVLLAGYSKGGNMVSDAVRLLKDELEGGLRQGMLDTSSFARINGSGLPPKPEQVVSRILSSIGLMSIAAGEEPLTKAEKDAGIRRVNILSDKDLIAGHFAAGREHEYHSRDELICVKGTGADMGHRWQEALLQAPGRTTGYIMADERARQHVQAISSQLIDGLPAIWDFRLEPTAGREREYRLSFRPGVLRKDIVQWGAELGDYVQQHLRPAGNVLPHPAVSVKVSVTKEAPTAIVLHVPENANSDAGFPPRLQAVLKGFCEEKGILLPPYVAEDVLDQTRLLSSPSPSHVEKVRPSFTDAGAGIARP
jgi:hypothetical protein